MAKDVDIKLDTTRFNAAVIELSRRTGISLPVVMRHEAGHVLKKCIVRTKVASQSKIKKAAPSHARIRSFSKSEGLSTTTGAKGGRKNTIWYKSPTAKKPFPVGEFSSTGKSGKAYSSSTRSIGPYIQSIVASALAAYKSLAATTLEQRLKSAGLARQSWIHIADSLGMDLLMLQGGDDVGAAMSKARGAVASSGKRHINGWGIETTAAAKTTITLVNVLPYASKLQLSGKLSSAINGRAAFLRRNIQEGVFNSAQQVAAKYPGMYVTR